MFAQSKESPRDPARHFLDKVAAPRKTSVGAINHEPLELTSNRIGGLRPSAGTFCFL